MSGGISASSIGTAGLIAQGVGTAASAYGAYNKVKGSQQADEYNAKVQENNALLAKWRSEDALTRGQTAVIQHGIKVAKLKGTQRASMAARGIDLGEGSALDILSDTDLLGQIDANTLSDNSQKEAWAIRNEASNYQANAGLLRQRAKNTNPWGDAAGSLLTGAGSVAKSWYSLKEKGA